MISNLFFLNSSGDVIIEKQFQDKFARTSLEAYWSTFIQPLNRLEDAPNVIQFSSFAHVQIVRDGVLILGITSHETPPMLIVEVLNMLASTLQSYIKSLDEQSLKDNFSLVYQLLEEMVHNGFPLTTELHLLEDLVPRSSLENRVKSLLLDKGSSSPTRDSGAAGGGSSFNPNSLEGTGNSATAFGSSSSHINGGIPGIAWRGEGVRYTANELLLDVTEFMDVVMDADGGVVRYSVRGQIDAVCKLGGMPEVTMRMTGIDGVEDIGFHRCVRHSQYESSRLISFVPPDGAFTLCTYRCKPQQFAANAPTNRHGVPQILPPFYTNPQVSFFGNTGRVTCMVGLRGPNALASGSMPGEGTSTTKKEVSRVVVVIPLPDNAEGINVTNCNFGTYAFDSTRKKIVWKLPHIPPASASSTPSFTCTVALNTSASNSNNNNKGAALPTSNGMEDSGPTSSSGLQDTNPLATLLAAERMGQDAAANGSSKKKKSKKQQGKSDNDYDGGSNGVSGGDHQDSAVMHGTGEPVSVSFMIMNHSLSDIRVDMVDVSNVKYKPYKAVRYVTKGGRFLIRTV